MKKNENRPGLQEMEQLLKELERRGAIDHSGSDPEYLNPWNLSKKKIRGKTFVTAKLPDKLPNNE